MKALLDTNIIIDREASAIFNSEIGHLFAWLDKLHYEKCIHPLTIQEIEKHKDKKVIDTFKIKLSSYTCLKTEAPLAPSVANLSKIDVSINDINDTRLLNELVNNRVNFLISNDKKIHEKASRLGVDRFVFTIESFLEKVTSENPGLVDYKVLSIKREYIGNIAIGDSFFNTLRNDYKGFEEWFNKKSDELAYVCKGADKILAFLYIKKENEDENYGEISPIFPKKKRIKIGTFKVDIHGYRLGERFLKIIFDNAIKQKVDEIYVTMFKKPEQERLINLLLEWGFKYWGIKNSPSGEEQVYVRDFSKSFNPTNPKSTFPYISLNSDSYLVPIYQQYHTDLFPDSILNTESPENFIENEPSRNSLSKVYVSRSSKKDLKPGDTIIFYRTGGFYAGVITTIGIVESIVTNIRDKEEFVTLCRKRSVFSNEELIKQWNYQSIKPFIVNLLYAYSFPRRINLKKLIELGIIKDILSAPRGFEKISKENFEKILRETNTDQEIIVN